MSEKKVYIDPMNIAFAKIMEIFTLIGLLVMLIFGLLYIMGMNPYLNIASVINHWGLPASKFWSQTKGIQVKGYVFLHYLNTMDCLSMLGICIMALAPLFSVLGAVLRARNKIYTILLIILMAEFIFAIIRPIIMAAGGE